MVRLPTLPKPTYRDMKTDVFKGLNIRGGIDDSVVTYVTFMPTLGIAAMRINKLGMDIRSFRVPLERAIREVVIPSIQRNFEAEGRPSWEPLSEFTLKRRQYEGFESGPILHRTGNLQRMMRQQNLWTITKDFAILASLPDKIWYGTIHQGGYEGSGGGVSVGTSKKSLGEIVSEAGPGRTVPSIPARPFVALQPDEEDEITDIFINWLEMRVNAAWPPGVL